MELSLLRIELSKSSSPTACSGQDQLQLTLGIICYLGSTTDLIGHSDLDRGRGRVLTLRQSLPTAVPFDQAHGSREVAP